MSRPGGPVAVAGPARPDFMADARVEALWDVVMALSAELAATRARLDALERVLAERGTLAPGAVDAWQPPADAGVARALDLQEYTRRVFAAVARD